MTASEMNKMSGMFDMLVDLVGYKETLYRLVCDYDVILNKKELTYLLRGMANQGEKVQQGLSIIEEAKKACGIDLEPKKGASR